jgi:hypothetical protein
MNKYANDDPKFHEYGAHFRYKDMYNRLKLIMIERQHQEKKQLIGSNKGLSNIRHITTNPSVLILPILNNNKTRNRMNTDILSNKPTLNKSKYRTAMDKVMASYDNQFKNKIKKI